jgi:hypothetical protein
MKTNFPNNLIDKQGQRIAEDDVIFDGNNYFRIYWNEKQPQVEAISPTYGYLHNLSQDELKNFERIGTFQECEHLMIVD